MPEQRSADRLSYGQSPGREPNQQRELFRIEERTLKRKSLPRLPRWNAGDARRRDQRSSAGVLQGHRKGRCLSDRRWPRERSAQGASPRSAAVAAEAFLRPDVTEATDNRGLIMARWARCGRPTSVWQPGDSQTAGGAGRLRIAAGRPTPDHLTCEGCLAARNKTSLGAGRGVQVLVKQRSQNPTLR
jgi:hypothetical protein